MLKKKQQLKKKKNRKTCKSKLKNIKFYTSLFWKLSACGASTPFKQIEKQAFF